jgi:hypothetical protein
MLEVHIVNGIKSETLHINIRVVRRRILEMIGLFWQRR